MEQIAASRTKPNTRTVHKKLITVVRRYMHKKAGGRGLKIKRTAEMINAEGRRRGLRRGNPASCPGRRRGGQRRYEKEQDDKDFQGYWAV